MAQKSKKKKVISKDPAEGFPVLLKRVLGLERTVAHLSKDGNTQVEGFNERLASIEKQTAAAVAAPIIAESESLEDDSWILEYETAIGEGINAEEVERVQRNAALMHVLKGQTIANRISKLVHADWLMPRGDVRFKSWPIAVLTAFWLEEVDVEGPGGETHVPYLDLCWPPRTTSSKGGRRIIKWAKLGNFIDIYIGRSPVLNREEFLILPGIVRWLLHVRALYVENGAVYTNNGIRTMLTEATMATTRGQPIR